jgi:sterol desaturase/sphingolipid hydroxylase (fatty acid hydroxylase superfamily)
VSDANFRLIVTLGLLALFLALEYIAPARKSALTWRRIGNQFGLALISAIAGRAALGGGLAGMAAYAQAQNWGLFNITGAPPWVAVIISFFLMDFAIWAQHLVLHKVPFLWRLHRVHHGDTVMDVTTALRFHPFEILASLAFKVVLVAALGAPPHAVFVFEMVLGAGALFTHANMALPRWLERTMRLVLITPTLHLIHHSPNPLETNSNFGFSFSFWDRLFGTFRGARIEPDNRIGLEEWRTPADQSLGQMLLNPFKSL